MRGLGLDGARLGLRAGSWVMSLFRLAALAAVLSKHSAIIVISLFHGILLSAPHGRLIEFEINHLPRRSICQALRLCSRALKSCLPLEARCFIMNAVKEAGSWRLAITSAPREKIRECL